MFFGNLAANEGVESQPQTILLTLCKHGIGDCLVLCDGEVMTVRELTARKPGKEQGSRVITLLPSYSVSPHRDQVQKGTL